MKAPLWVEREDVLAIHDMMLAQHGGLAGLRDDGLLQSALHRPRDLFSYGGASLHTLAAAYAHGIMQNHPFNDGNKRTGFLTAAVFLEVNGKALTAPEVEVVEQTLGLAAHTVDEGSYARWLKANTRRRR